MPKRSEGAKVRWFEDRGAFYVTWTEGRRSRKCSTGASSREEADIFLAEWLQERVSGKPVRASDPAKVLITDCLAAYAEEHGPTVMGQETMARALSHLIDFWHGKSARSFARSIVKLAALAMAPSVANLRSYGQRSIGATSTAASPPPFDLDGGVIDFEIPGRKATKKRRGQCPIPAKLRPHLIRAKAKGGAMGYVINRDGKSLGDIKKGFAAAVRRAGLDDITPHTLKHTAISWRLDAGVSIWDVSKLFATSVKTIEKTYGHSSPEAMRNAADKMVRDGVQKGAQRASNRANWAKSA
jgi:hypothetical protein